MPGYRSGWPGIYWARSDRKQAAGNRSHGLYYAYDDLPVIVDMLRNEQPVYLIYNGAGNSRLSTASEPVGEGEI